MVSVHIVIILQLMASGIDYGGMNNFLLTNGVFYASFSTLEVFPYEDGDVVEVVADMQCETHVSPSKKEYYTCDVFDLTTAKGHWKGEVL